MCSTIEVLGCEGIGLVGSTQVIDSDRTTLGRPLSVFRLLFRRSPTNIPRLIMSVVVWKTVKRLAKGTLSKLPEKFLETCEFEFYSSASVVRIGWVSSIAAPTFGGSVRDIGAVPMMTMAMCPVAGFAQSATATVDLSSAKVCS